MEDNGNLPDRLDAVNMKRHAAGATQCGDGGNVKEDTGFIVGPHDGRESHVGVGQRGSEGRHIEIAAGVDRNLDHAMPSLGKGGERLAYGAVFNR